MERLTVRGYGEDRPAALNETEEGRKRNRRVEVKIRWNHFAPFGVYKKRIKKGSNYGRNFLKERFVKMKEIKGLKEVGGVRAVLGILLAIVLGMGALAHGEKGEKVFLRLDPGGHTAMISDLFFFDHGKKLISASDDKTIRIWDVSDLRHPELIRTIRGEIGRGFGMVYAIALDPAERILAVGGFLAHGHGINDNLVGIVRLHDLKTGKVL